MPSQAWLDAAKKADRDPVLLMAVESVAAIKVQSTTTEDWEAAKSADPQLNLESIVGAVSLVLPNIPASNLAEYPIWMWTGVFDKGITFTPDYDCYISILVMKALWDPSNPVDSIRWRLVITDSADSVVFTSEYVDCEISAQGVGVLGFPVVGGEMSFSVPAVFVGASTAVNCYLESDHPYFQSPMSYYDVVPALTYEEGVRIYYAAGAIQTKTLDLGVQPTADSRFGARDTVRSGCTASYSARGSNDAGDWTNLGIVEDGDPLSPFRYYDFTASFTSDGSDTPVLEEIEVVGGDSQYLYFSTHEGIPVQSARPFLQNTLGSLSSKLELMKLGSTGEISPKLFYLRETFEMLRDGYLRNKVVSLKLGFNNGMSEPDYNPVFTGLWYDASINLYASIIDVKTRTIMSRFQKVKLPKETTGVRSDTTCNPIEWVNENIVTVMLDVIDYMGIPDRYLDRTGAEAIRDGARSGSDWAVSRRLDKDNKEDAVKLLEELSVLAGIFILQEPDGRMVFQVYDPLAATVAEISTDIATFSPIEMGQGELYTRQQILFTRRHVGDLEAGSVRGAWASDMDISDGDSVTRDTVTWYALQSHRTSTANEPAAGGDHRAFWTTDWLTDTAYLVGDVRISAGPLYTCFSNHTSATATEPGIGNDWHTKWRTKPEKTGNSEEDYYNALVKINQASEVAWGLNADVESGDTEYQKNPGYQKTWLEKWNATPAARTALANRMDAWFATPKMQIKASDLPPQFDEIHRGAMVGITGLMLPVAGAVWGVPCNNKKFMVMSKTTDSTACTVSFGFLEV